MADGLFIYSVGLRGNASGISPADMEKVVTWGLICLAGTRRDARLLGQIATPPEVELLYWEIPKGAPVELTAGAPSDRQKQPAA